MGKKQVLRSGRIEYTARAFLQDAQEAMGTDVVKGLIELITNADDSYARANTSGPIRVEVDHSRGSQPHNLVVKDRASGMSSKEMVAQLLTIGGRTSGLAEGMAVRGNRGRGAKDLVAFGDVEFTSIKDGLLSTALLRQTGDWEFLRQDARPTKEDRSELGIRRGNGTVVTVYSQSVRIPRHKRLRDLLINDYQLRDVMADRDRQITLVSTTKTGRPRKARLRYKPPVTEPLLNTHIDIDGYSGAGRVPLSLGKLPDRSDESRSVPTRPSGILIKGKRAIYDNTLFGYEGHPIAGWIHGRLNCDYIDELANEHDDLVESGETPPETNPLPIISRRRRGLTSDHPFWDALSKAVNEAIKPVIASLEKAEQTGPEPKESADTRRRLDNLGLAAARMLQQESMREHDDDVPPPGPVPGAPDPLVVYPKQMNIVVGLTKTLSVVCDTEGLNEGDEVTVELEPPDAFKVTNEGPVRLGPHRNGRTDVLTAPVRIKALNTEEGLFEASIGERSGLAVLEGIPAPPPPTPIEPPDRLQFEKDTYSVGINKTKALAIWAPITVAEQHVAKGVRVRSDTEGVTVLDGGMTTMALDEDLGFYIANIRVKGVQRGSNATLYASLGEHTTRTRVMIVSKDPGIAGLNIEFANHDTGNHRSYFDPPDRRSDEEQTLWIVKKHPSLLPLVGEDLSGADTSEANAVLAEIVAEALVSQIVTEKHGDYPVEASVLYQSHAERLTRLLPKVQKVLDVVRR